MSEAGMWDRLLAAVSATFEGEIMMIGSPASASTSTALDGPILRNAEKTGFRRHSYQPEDHGLDAEHVRNSVGS